jgi:hypothetical protein
MKFVKYFLWFLLVLVVCEFSSCASYSNNNIRIVTNSNGVWTIDGWSRAEYEKMPNNSSKAVLKYLETVAATVGPVRYEMTVYWDESAELDVIALRRGRKYAEMFLVYNQYTDTLVKLADLKI